MEIKEPRLRALLAQAGRNAEYGKNAAAESMYRDILSEAPEAEEAWLGLARVLGDEGAKRAALERALLLSPQNPAAVAGLAELDGRPVPPEAAAALALADEEEAEEPRPGPAGVEPPDPPPARDIDYTLVCYRHPQRMTSLRCYNCNRPICIQCANKTPVGYICPECQRQAEDAFYNAKPSDYLIAAIVSLPISLVVGLLLVSLARGMLFFLLIFFISGAVGSFIGRITKRAIGGRRGRYLPGLVVAMMFIGVLIPVVPLLLAILGGSGGALFALIGPGIYLFVGASAAYWQMR
ncbi:MAG TPA: hypothetical protein PK829_06220 [Promineifilum sp.]|nr:hypothetical protein [Promineifilum sp.]